jgi:threonine dehydrogenase-like Zn-dependent dehydrogenase
MIAKKQLPMSDIITHKLPIANFLEGIKMVMAGQDSVKIMLIP